LQVTARQQALEVTSPYQSYLRGVTGPKSAPVGPRHLRKLSTLLPSLMNQPPPAGGELGRLTAIYLWIALAGLRQVKQSFELFELF
jgi:hypothetical protein